MRVAFGLKAHSGWAALVVLGERDGELELVERRRLELVDQDWARAPYHAAESLEARQADALVRRGVASALRVALRELKAAQQRESARGNRIAACAVLAGAPMPSWSTAEILAVHFRMHKAEGVLFRDALSRAAATCGLPLAAIPEKELAQRARAALGSRAAGLTRRLAALGKAAGPPWGADQKDAALAALVALLGAP